MKRFFKTITGAVLVCAVATLTGCGLMFDANNPKIQLSSLTGFKTTYNDGTYELDDTFELYSKHILTEIYANFAIPSTEDNKSKLTTLPKNIAENYDKIRVQVDSENEVQNVAWKWSFSRTLLGCQCEEEYENIISYYADTSVQEKYYNEWAKIYTIPLEVVAIQIAMGQTPQVFTIDITNQTTTVYTDENKTKKVDENYLAEVKEQFKTGGVYVGFTEENVATFKNYFLNEIVGNNIVGTQYDKIAMKDNNDLTYSALFDQILTLDVGLKKDFYTPYPASFVQDIEDSSCFAGKEHYVLDHVIAKEYQSVTFMTSKDTYICGFYFAFEAEYDLELDIQVNFYNSKTQQVENYYDSTIEIKAGKFEAKNWLMIDLGKQLNITDFNNNLVSASTQTQISNTNQNSQYYTYSVDGTYVEGSLIGCDCLTISFKPHKTQNEYCPFKWVIDLEMGE